MYRCLASSVAGIIALLPVVGAATVTVFEDDLAGFESAAGGPVPVQVDFDSVSAGTDIDGFTLTGATLSSPDGNTLEVVDGASTFTGGGFTGVIDPDTNRLFPTSGSQVLSPGGLELVPGNTLAEKDSLEIVFAVPQPAVGLDILFQSFDSGLNTRVDVFDATDSLVAFVNLSGSGLGGSPAAPLFVGFVSDDPSTHIHRVWVRETDSNAQFPDSNVGYDTLRYTGIPVPSGGPVALGALALLLLVAAKGSLPARFASRTPR